MKIIGSYFNQLAKLFDRTSEHPETFLEELNYQCSRISLPLAIIAAFPWIPYIEIDARLHPNEPLIIYLRIGLTIVSLTIALLHLLPWARRNGLILLIILGLYLELATALITALSGAQAYYIGGYLFLLMIIPLVPVPASIQLFGLFSSLILFFSVSFYKGVSFAGDAARYSLNDIIATSSVALFFIYLLGKMRFHTWMKSRRILEQRKLLQERNLDLELKNSQVLTQRKEIERRNRILEGELKMARKIQKQLISHDFVGDNMAFLYKPMDLVGGDFFDIIRFRNTDATGLFISDVSGHGVPAAFITAIMKSLIMKAGSIKIDPAALLFSLNDVLVNLSGGNFVTAFYGIYEKSAESFIYANAGHHHPFLVQDSTLTELTGKSGPPLALWQSEAVIKAGKTYQNSRINVNKRDRIILYTDGLTEASNMTNTSEMFGEERLKVEIQNGKGDEPRKFVGDLYQNLVVFRGSDNFDDDVCLLCYDID